MVTHRRPASGDVQDLLGVERALAWVRLGWVVLVITQLPVYAKVDLAPIAVAVVIALAGSSLALLAMDDRRPIAQLRSWSMALVAADVAMVAIAGHAFVRDVNWVGYLYYPLVVVEAAVVGGLVPALVTTGISMVIYSVELWIHAQAGHPDPLQTMLATLAMLGLTGLAIALFGHLANRGRRDLRLLLDLTSALANQHAETETLELLDRRLHETVGGRVRSIAVMDLDGSFQVIRWHSSRRRVLDRGAIEVALGNYDEAAAGFHAGRSITLEVDSWSVAAGALGLPDWTRSVTLVPIVTEGRWVGVLPVLWPTPHVPGGGELRLLYSLAEQMGIAITQGQLQQARQLALTDPLTGLLNHRAIMDELRAFLARATRAGSPVAVLFCDLDGFKQVNDSRGHETGDMVLRDVGQAIRGAIRTGDVVGRYGGDELLVVAADATTEQAATLARRVGDAVRAAAAGTGVGVSIGIAVFPATATTAADLLAAADRAMYQAKSRGGNTVVLSGFDRDA